MQDVKCPYCGVLVRIKEAGEVVCAGCGGRFFAGFDKLKQAWVSTDPSSVIQAIFIQGKKKG